MRAVASLCLCLWIASIGTAQEGRGVVSEDRSLAGFPDSRYFLLTREEAETPAKGHGLLVVLPGGAGTPDFLPWVKDGIFGQGAGQDWIGAMVTAVKWTGEQKIIWPTTGNRVAKMKYGTEDYVAAVVNDIRKAHEVDPKRVLLLSWSSSGPAAYEIAPSGRHPFTGFYIAMSVFAPSRRASPRRATGLRFFLDQSPQD